MPKHQISQKEIAIVGIQVRTKIMYSWIVKPLKQQHRMGDHDVVSSRLHNSLALLHKYTRNIAYSL